MKKTAVICVAFVFIFAIASANAATFTVSTIADTNDGVCDGDCSLREAIASANSSATNDIIEFNQTVFNTAQIIHLTSGAQLQIINNGTLTINGTGINLLTVRGTNQSRIFSIGTGANVSLNGINIAGSTFSGNGGGVANEGGSLALNNCKIGGNTAFLRGGGIHNNGTLNLTNSIIIGNLAVDGGGGIYNQSGTITLENTYIQSNSNGGIFHTSGNLTINNSTIYDNSGGGITNFSSASANITNSTINGNLSSISGGGIANSGSLTAVNVTITNNSASTTGGGIFNIGTVQMASSTINSNYAPSGGGVRNVNSFTARNTIFGDNLADKDAPRDFAGVLNSQNGYNLLESAAGATFTGITTGNLLGVDAKLGALINNDGLTLTCALLPNSPAIDAGDPANITASDQRGVMRPQNGDGIGANRQDIGAFERIFSGTPPIDFDGDGKTDLSIYRPSIGLWLYQLSGSQENSGETFGNATDKIVPADYTGDGKTDVAIFRPASGTWFILRSETSTFYTVNFGISTDIPAPADFDGDNRADIVVFRASSGTWFLNQTSGGIVIRQFGTSGDVPAVGDYDGDKRADIAIYRPAQGQWWVSRSSLGVIAFQFGAETDKPVQGDYTGDGKTDVAFWRSANGNWFILRSEDFSFYAFPFGLNGDKPAPGDYDGDARFDAAIFRPSDALWFIQRTTSGTLIQQFGEPTDIPVPAAFVP